MPMTDEDTMAHMVITDEMTRKASFPWFARTALGRTVSSFAARLRSSLMITHVYFVLFVNREISVDTLFQAYFTFFLLPFCF
jgi:hypothetical protein